jgi:hypothetical protein
MLSHARVLFCVCVLLCAITVGVNAQDKQAKDDNNANRPNYEISLQLLASTGINERGELPITLAPIEKKLEREFGKNNYRLALNLAYQVSQGGGLDVSEIIPFSQNLAEDKSYNFYKLWVNGINSNATGKMQISILGFEMRALPIATSPQDKDGFPGIKFVFIPLSVAPNEPTIIGTTTNLRPDRLLVLVLTVKPVPTDTGQTTQK